METGVKYDASWFVASSWQLTDSVDFFSQLSVQATLELGSSCGWYKDKSLVMTKEPVSC